MQRRDRFTGGGLWFSLGLAALVVVGAVGPQVLGADRNVLCEEFTAPN